MKTTTMIRRTFFLFALAGAASQAVAQPNDANDERSGSEGAQHRIEHRIEQMKRRLAISDDQAAKIATVLQAEHRVLAEDRATLRAATPDQKLIARTQLQKDRLDMRSQVLQNLNTNQLAKAEELRKRRMMRIHEERIGQHRLHRLHD